jgi:MerR family transcriptional regulator/heat shock protein HspR
MTRKYLTVVEIIKIFDLEERFLLELEEEEIICPVRKKGTTEKRYHTDEIEKLRLAKILVEEMDVNLPGVDIILRMRHDMLAMRKQFDAILEDLAEKLKNKQ